MNARRDSRGGKPGTQIPLKLGFPWRVTFEEKRVQDQPMPTLCFMLGLLLAFYLLTPFLELAFR